MNMRELLIDSLIKDKNLNAIELCNEILDEIRKNTVYGNVSIDTIEDCFVTVLRDKLIGKNF